MQDRILDLPEKLQARFINLTARMLEYGPNLGLPHTDSLGDGIFELRLKGSEGIARALYCMTIGKKIIFLHCFVKKSQKTPLKELRLAKLRMREIKE